MGPGWSLTGLSAIVRCGKTWASTGGTATTVGSPAAVTLSTTDDICLDGNRLRKTSGNQLAAGSTYQTEIADFSNVTAYGTQGNGPQYFIVQGKDGRSYEYGNTSDSRIFGSGATTPYAWALNKVRDRQSNSMVFTYSGGTAVTLTKIQYTISPGGLNTALYEVDFHYVARTGGTTITKIVAGSEVSQANQLDNVTVLSLQPSSTIVRKYQLGYAASATTNRPMLQTVQECGGSAGTDCIRPTTINYQSGGTGWSSTPTPTGLTGQYGFIPVDLNGDGIPDVVYGKPSGSNIAWYARIATATGYGAEISTGATTPPNTDLTFGAFDGTGKQEFLAVVGAIGSGCSVYYYNGTGFSSVAVNPQACYANFAVDWDGDGLPDIVANSVNVVSVMRNTTQGGTVSFASNWTTVYNYPSNVTWVPLYPSRASAADFNGDGRADVLIQYAIYNQYGNFYTYYNDVLLSNGFSGLATDIPQNPNGTIGAPLPPITFGDWNGDGCTDILSAGTVWISGCTGDFGLGVGGSGMSVGSSSGTNPMPVDWDGDGQTDLLYTLNGTLWLVRSKGDSAPAAAVNLNISAPSTTSFIPVDRDSDGQPDLLFVDSANGYAVSYYPHKGVNTPPDLANSITDGFGINFSPSYYPISQSYYTKCLAGNSACTLATFPDMEFQGPMYVVYQFSASDGKGGTYTNDFWYWYARLNLQGRGFEGFYAARQHDSRNGVFQLDYYRRDFPYIGSLFTQETIASDAATYIAYTVNDGYTKLTPGGLSGTTSCTLCYFPYFTTSTVYNYEPTGAKAGGPYAYVSYTSTTYKYDSYGNLTDTTATTSDTDSGAGTPPYPSPFNGQQWITEIANTITNDNSAANWCLGRPSTTTTKKTVPGQAAQTRTVGHTMDYAKCRATVETVEPNDTRLKVTTNFGFDACGNTNSVSVVGLDQNGVAMPARTTTTSYGTRCQLPESVTNADGITSTVYGYAASPVQPASSTLPASTKDPNGIQTSWQYDDFGRKIKETRPDGTSTTYAYTDSLSGWAPLPDLRLLVMSSLYDSTGTQLRREAKYYDGLDRLRQDEGDRVLGATWDIETFDYDSQGRKTEDDLPTTSSSNGYHKYSYDVANRLYQDRLYDSSGTLYRTILITYLGQTVRVTDPLNHTITKVTDVAGKIRQVTDDNSNNTVAGTTKYTFDPFGNLITILDADNYTSSYTYNIRGFKTASNDADTGSWTFTPDSL